MSIKRLISIAISCIFVLYLGCASAVAQQKSGCATSYYQVTIKCNSQLGCSGSQTVNSVSGSNGTLEYTSATVYCCGVPLQSNNIIVDGCIQGFVPRIKMATAKGIRKQVHLVGQVAPVVIAQSRIRYLIEHPPVYLKDCHGDYHLYIIG